MSPRIYVACLAAYNAGHLHGDWIDADQTPEQLSADIDAMLADSPIPGAEEWAVHDYEDMPEGMGECPSLDEVSEVARLIAEEGDAALAYFSEFGTSKAAQFHDRYCGEYSSGAEFVAERVEGEYDIPQALEYYIDYELMWRDWQMDGYTENNGHFFRRD